MLPVSRRLPALAAAFAAAVAARAQETRADLDARFARDARPLFVAYCGKCHGADEPKGDLDLVRFASAETLRGDFRPWLDVVDLLASGEMPPAKAPQPSATERQRMVAIVREVLADHARAHAGDPGPVTLRRLDNAQYRYAVQDLTGLDALDPTREFPADGAAGEGFTNVGQALAMSPTLAQKHLAAAKEVAAHAALLPDGLRFLRGTTRRDQTDELVAAIRAFHRRHTDARGSNVVHVQGHAFTTDVGGRLPAGRYLEAALALRASAVVDDAAVGAAAARHGLSPKYLGILWRALVDGPPSALLDALRARWRAAAAGDGEALAQWLAPWQQRLFAFRNVGHIGKVGGPKAWMEPVGAAVEELALRLPTTTPKDGREATAVVLAVAVAGTGPARVALRQPRLVRAGRRDVLLRDVPAVADALASRRVAVAATAARCLQAADAVLRQGVDRAAAASAAGVDVAVLGGWLELLGGSAAPPSSLPLLDGPIRDASGHAEVRGWGGKDLPSVFANASATELRIPGTMAPHGFAVHPTPAQRAVVAWQSPLSARVRVAATVQRAHLACGNGVDWELRLHRGAAALLLASGVADDAALDRAEAFDFDAERGDVLALSVGPRAQDHRCDLTAVDLVVTAADGARFDLAADVAPDVLRGNPHPGRDGAPSVWRFAGEPRELQGELAHAHSTLGQWLLAPDAAQRAQLAERLQRMVAGALAPATAADASMLELVGSVDGPLLRTCLDVVCVDASVGPDLVVDAPGVLALRAPAELAAGAEWAATAQIAAGSAPDAAAQVALAADAAQPAAPMLLDAPFLVGSAAGRARVDAACAAFRALFPAALCYQQVVPIDEAVTLTQFHREDEPLRRLVLDDAAAAELDRMWRELHFVAQDALTAVDAFEQIWQYATQDADPSAFEPLRAPILARAAAFRGELLAAEPRHLDAVLALADRAWRRPLRAEEQQGLRALYASLRAEGLGHDDAVRLLLARVLASPAFLYRAEDAVSGAAWGPVGAEALANRLSFFVAASLPDAALRADAASGALLDPEALVAHGRRLLAAGGARRLAVEFGTSWLHLRDFADQAEKSERLFPGFRALRGSMHEEVVRFLADWFERDGSVHELLDADHTFVDNALAAHYGLPTAATDGWRRVDGLRALGRGGLLGMAAVLASQSGASRTSPILRGNWIAEALLGDRLPKPPKDVPRLPEEEDGQSLTMRELTERHRRDPACAHCHDRIDPYGLALEAFDFVGRRRIADLGGRALDLRVATKDGAQFADLAGLRDHLLQRRRDAFEEQFLRKLLGYALGRSVLLTDQPLLDAIRAEWPQHGHRVGFALASILKSPQFRCARGGEWTER